jgi:hypothetical protein
LYFQVNIEQLKDIARVQQIKALPQVGLYRPNHGQLLTFQAVPSRMKVVKKNIATALAHPDKFFRLDPNGLATVVDKDPTPELTAIKHEAKKLKSSTAGLFEHLLATASGRCDSSVASTLRLFKHGILHVFDQTRWLQVYKGDFSTACPSFHGHSLSLNVFGDTGVKLTLTQLCFCAQKLLDTLCLGIDDGPDSDA